MCGWRRRGRSRRDRATASRPIGATRSGLVRLLGAGELSFAFVPSVADEHFRDLIRAIEDVRGDLMRARHRLGKFLLRRGERYPGPGRAWTGTHMAWLRGLRFEDVCSQATFADYLASVELLAGRRATLIDALGQQVPASSHAPVIARLRCFRGIDTLSAAGLCAEVGDFARFPAPTRLSGFLGIVPSERTSDTKRRQGSITKAGPATPAGCWSRPPTTTATSPRSAPRSRAARHGQDPRVIEIAWRAQRRLHQRWQRLHHERRKPAGVVAIACARELAAFLLGGRHP